ncbi:MAG: hypothetical protein R3310_17915, partial [Candidatus Competibacteraceae bacterium]|nr:hypothetical protein [Candidatus Competibacteraceae bacterium]
AMGLLAMFIVFVLLVLLFAGWVAWDWVNTEASVDNLAAVGFKADERLEGRPAVAFDRDRRQLAFVGAERATVYDYDQVLDWEWGSYQVQGWQQQDSPRQLHHVVFYMKYQDEPAVKVTGLEEKEAAYWRQRLETLLGER